MADKKIVISLEPIEQIELERLVLDDDEIGALNFLKNCLYPRMLKEQNKIHCLPYFELEARKRAGAEDENLNPWLKKKK